MIKHDVVAYGRIGDYAAFPGIIHAEKGIYLEFFAQDLGKLNQAQLHPHYAPIAHRVWLLSTDNGRTWRDAQPAADIGKVITATRGDYYAGIALDDGKFLKLEQRHIPGSSTAREPLTARIFDGQLSIVPNRSFEVGSIGPFSGYNPFTMIRVKGGKLLVGGQARKARDIADVYGVYTAVFLEGTPDGTQWRYLSHVPNPNRFGFTENALVRAGDGRLICLLRVDFDPPPPPGELPEDANGNGFARDGYGYYIYYSESTDEGRTWSEPVRTPVWGHPPFALRLRSGRLLMVCGHRRPPFEVRAVLSHDDGRTWDTDNIRTIHRWTPGKNDIGYPVAVQLEDGAILCAFYGYSTPDAGEKTPHGIFVSVFEEAWVANSGKQQT